MALVYGAVYGEVYGDVFGVAAVVGGSFTDEDRALLTELHGSVSASVLAAAIAAQLQLAAVRREGEAGPVISDRIVFRGTTWRIALPFDLPVDWTRVEFTARVKSSDDQAASLLHVVVSNPSGADGLQIFNGSTDVTAADASISVDGSPVVILDAEVAAESPLGSYCYDAKVWNPDGVDQSVRGTLYVEADVTRSPLAA